MGFTETFTPLGDRALLWGFAVFYDAHGVAECQNKKPQ
jgi:hypothetical protein